MQAIILATGETNPLQPLTEALPSAMLPLVNRPIMVYAVEMLARQGFKQIFVSLHSRPGEIEAYFGTGRRWGVNLNYLLQRDAWGTAGALRWAGRLLSEPFIVMPADVLSDVDLAELIDQHVSRGPQATVVVHQAYGEDKKDTGVYLLEPCVIDLIPAHTYFDIHHQLLPCILASGMAVDSYRLTGYWNPIKTFQELHEAQRVYLYSAWGNHADLGNIPPLRYPSIDGRQVAPGIWVGRNHVIHPNARIAPPVCIGENCLIGKNTELGPEVIVGDYVMVDDEATICQSTILDHTYVGELVNLDNRIVKKNLVIDFATAQSLQVSDPFLLAPVPISVVRAGLRRLVNGVAALILMLLLSPLLVGLGLLMLASTGKIFRTSARQGFQSNINNTGMAGAGSTYDLLRYNTRRSDGKETRLGKWLESWEGDRLPELWNVIKGDMLLVGVLPMDPEQAERLSDHWHQRRNDYFSGFTGLWYVQASKGCDQDEIYVADAFYVATHTWLKDLSLFLRTPSAWMRRRREG